MDQKTINSILNSYFDYISNIPKGFFDGTLKPSDIQKNIINYRHNIFLEIQRKVMRENINHLVNNFIYLMESFKQIIISCNNFNDDHKTFFILQFSISLIDVTEAEKLYLLREIPNDIIYYKIRFVNEYLKKESNFPLLCVLDKYKQIMKSRDIIVCL